MESVNVSSRFITQIEYEPVTELYGTITVHFKNGEKHDYEFEHPNTWEAFKASGSKGSFYWSELRIAAGRSG